MYPVQYESKGKIIILSFHGNTKRLQGWLVIINHFLWYCSTTVYGGLSYVSYPRLILSLISQYNVLADKDDAVRGRYFICSESIKKMSIFAWHLVERSMQIPIKIPTGSIQDKESEYFTFSYLHGSWLFIIWFHCGFCNKKGTFGIFTGFGHLQTSETSGRNMIVELDSRHPLLPITVWENEDLTLILRLGENGNFCKYKCFQCWCKGEKHENKQNYNC